ncbi:hypothetical protein ABOZ73_00355 [Caulobacter sp. 73W]|uniref:Uncharacterized protein n=1 Tax=Caulobacter sp. 73W TaxID=3161137 RepID=A0AB39KUE8_9CAUL
MSRLSDPVWLQASTHAWGILVLVWITLFGAVIERSVAREEGRSWGRKLLGALKGTALAVFMTFFAAAVLQISTGPG